MRWLTRLLAAQSAAVRQCRRHVSGPARLTNVAELLRQAPTSNERVRIAGRVMRLREHGSIIYLDVQQENERIQVTAERKRFETPESYAQVSKCLHRGAIIEACGTLGQTSTGQQSLFCDELTLLTPCVSKPPTDNQVSKGRLTRGDKRRQRFIELLVDPRMRRIVQVRAQILSRLREHFAKNHYLEVSTPVLSSMVGGAGEVHPFETIYFDGKIKLSMRVAPELYLKMLVVGGLERIYEIGPQFRNEGISRTHSPEFTMCEYYHAYGNYLDGMEELENILEDIAETVQGDGTCTVSFNRADVSLRKPFQRLDYMDALRDYCGSVLPSCEELHTEDARQALLALCRTHKIEIDKNVNVGRALDKLAAYLVEPHCIQPTFLINHPLLLSPLAQPHDRLPHRAARFELFIGGMEIANGYSELTDPVAQARNLNDEELSLHAQFLEALRVGLPPTVGCGLSIDRLCMILTDTWNIKDTILFPLNKSYAYQRKRKKTHTSAIM